MIIAELNKQVVKIPTEWSEITYSQAAKCYRDDYPVVGDMLEWFEHYDFVKRMFAILTTCKDVDRVRPDDVVYLFDKYLAAMVYDLKAANPTTYKPRLINYFAHKGRTYLMPTNLDVLGGNVMLQHDQDVKRFVEASNLLAQFSKLKKEGFIALPMFVASIVKEDRMEEWDEAKIIKRAQDFDNLPMDVIWEVFFCISLLTIKLGSSTLQYMSERQTATSRLIQMLGSRLGRWRLQRAALQAQLSVLMQRSSGTFWKYLIT